jgi:hypothetical protein
MASDDLGDVLMFGGEHSSVMDDVEDQDSTSGSKHTSHLGNRNGGPVQVLDYSLRVHRVESGVVERERLRIAHIEPGRQLPPALAGTFDQ